jgi:hypothetical protein
MLKIGFLFLILLLGGEAILFAIPLSITNDYQPESLWTPIEDQLKSANDMILTLNELIKNHENQFYLTQFPEGEIKQKESQISQLVSQMKKKDEEIQQLSSEAAAKDVLLAQLNEKLKTVRKCVKKLKDYEPINERNFYSLTEKNPIYPKFIDDEIPPEGNSIYSFNGSKWKQKCFIKPGQTLSTF